MAEDGLIPVGAMLIGDERVSDSSGGTHAHVFAATGETNARVALAGAAEIERAVSAAWRAQREWMGLGVERRRDLLLALADAVESELDSLVRLSVQDNAVPVSVSALQPATLVRYLRYYAGWVDKGHGQSVPGTAPSDVNLVEREPYGVVGVIIPWNGPLFQIGMNVVPALAAGNAVVLKPSELAPLTSLRFGELCREAGLPPGLLSVAPGGAEAGEALVRHPGIRKIHFTGSTATARRIHAVAAENLTPVATELGGKAANLVFADADLDQAAQLAALSGPLGLSGQSCAAGNRILVQDTVYDEFAERFLTVVRNAAMGDPFAETTLVGPVISEAAADKILGVVEDAVRSKSGRLLAGGKRADGKLAAGFYVEPTVFAEVDTGSALGREEVFGPVASLIRFTAEDEAVAIANDTRFGLVNYVNTTDLARAHRVARQLESGTVWVNQGTDIGPTAPYGGYKQSGSGRSGGLEGLHQFQQVKNIRIGVPA
ncbi:aldehyde dehydrogenase family protein [Amycolatopsis sp. Poz14]|nr:aldehyde dehydrogenase family protein [Amycolatopsis sp. Poz14]